MIVVDASKRVSLDEVARHEWVRQGNYDDFPLPDQDLPDAGAPDLPESDVELILLRMQEGGYGTAAEITRY